MDPKFHLAMSNPVHTGLVGTLPLTSCKTEHTLKLSFLNDGHSAKCRLKAHGLLGVPGWWWRLEEVSQPIWSDRDIGAAAPSFSLSVSGHALLRGFAPSLATCQHHGTTEAPNSKCKIQDCKPLELPSKVDLCTSSIDLSPASVQAMER